MNKLQRRRYHPIQILLILPITFALVACSVISRVPTVSDDRLESLVRHEAAPIIAVTKDRNEAARYTFYLSDFPRKDILGLSTGNGRIYLSYDLARYAASNPRHLWLLRQTLAHEIAHEIKRHAKETG